MPIDRDTITAFLYVLARDYLPWGEVRAIIDESLAVDPAIYVDSPDAGIGSILTDRLLGAETSEPSSAMGHLNATAIIAYDLAREQPAPTEVHDCIRAIADKPHRAPLYLSDLIRDCDRRRRETLREAAKVLIGLRDKCDAKDINTWTDRFQINAMIDRCNLASLPDGGVAYSSPTRDYPATDAEVRRLRRFEDGVTELLGEPVTGTDGMLERLRERLSGPADMPYIPPSDSDISRWLQTPVLDPENTDEWTLIDSEAAARRFVGKRVEVRAPETEEHWRHVLDGKDATVSRADGAWLHLVTGAGPRPVDWRDRGNVSLRLAEVDQ